MWDGAFAPTGSVVTYKRKAKVTVTLTVTRFASGCDTGNRDFATPLLLHETGQLIFGMSESRTELIAWLNDLLQVNYTKVEQCGTGGAYCQIMDSVYGELEC